MTRVAFIAHLSEVSGSGIALVETVAGLSQVFECWLILPGHGPLETLALKRKIRCEVIDNPEVALAESAVAQKVRTAGARMRYIRQLSQFLRKNRIDLAYVNSSASVFAGMGARMAGCPIAWHIHETLDTPNRSTRMKAGIIRRLSDGLVYASQSAMKHLPPPAGTPAMVARNYVPVQSLARIASRRNELLPGKPRILLNGTFHRKGADVLLKAASSVADSSPSLDFTVEIAGGANSSDTHYFNLTQAADEPPLQGRVEFSGLQEGLAEALARATVFVSASRNEALPISIVEAMAAGVPVISTDVGDCADLLDYGKCGWVIPAEDSSALAAALLEVLTQPDLVAAKTGHALQKVTSLYHEENFWEPLQKFLENLIARR